MAEVATAAVVAGGATVWFRRATEGATSPLCSSCCSRRFAGRSISWRKPCIRLRSVPMTAAPSGVIPLLVCIIMELRSFPTRVVSRATGENLSSLGAGDGDEHVTSLLEASPWSSWPSRCVGFVAVGQVGSVGEGRQSGEADAGVATLESWWYVEAAASISSTATVLWGRAFT